MGAVFGHGLVFLVRHFAYFCDEKTMDGCHARVTEMDDMDDMDGMDECHASVTAMDETDETDEWDEWDEWDARKTCRERWVYTFHMVHSIQPPIVLFILYAFHPFVLGIALWMPHRPDYVEWGRFEAPGKGIRARILLKTAVPAVFYAIALLVTSGKRPGYDRIYFDFGRDFGGHPLGAPELPPSGTSSFSKRGVA